MTANPNGSIVVTLSPTARERLKILVEREAEPDGGLRVTVVPGGCSGFEYALELGSAAEGDEVVEADGARVFIDRYSIPYLIGAEFDYEEGFQGAGFVIKNPNAESSCGCGKSFQA